MSITLTPTSHLKKNVGSGEMRVQSFQESHSDQRLTYKLTPTFHLGKNVGSGEMRVNSFQESHSGQRLTYKLTEESSCTVDLHRFQTRFVIGWDNNRDGDITMPLSLKTIGSAGYRDQ